MLSVGLLLISDRLVAEAATFTTHNRHNRRTSMLSAGFELSFSAADERLRPHGTFNLYLTNVVNKYRFGETALCFIWD
jgi:PIN domain nuclease of toxin-antitoxin system